MTAFTIGHSTHELAAFVELLERHVIACLADVRTAPRSRRTPQFNREALSAALAAVGVDYVHLPELGGWRTPVAGSEENAGWRHRSFRGYADHMASPEFAAGLERLTALSAARRTAIMCAEAAWWRCHRRLVSDALVAGGWTVEHIGPDGRLARHELTEFARVRQDGRVVYPRGGAEQLAL